MSTEKKFGTFSGVFIPSFEAILGAVLFILLPILVADLGLVPALAIVIVANLVTLSTAFSLGDCASNLHKVGPGGMYAISKGSLGRAFGGSIGIQLFLAQAISIGFYAIAFATPLQKIIQDFPGIIQFLQDIGFSSELQQKQAIGTVIAFIGFIAGFVGADFVVKIQFFIFLILVVSIGSMFAAPFLGIVDPNSGLAVFDPGRMNLWGGKVSGLPSYGIFLALTTFFPAVTGIDAGVGMSGSLKNPRKSLSKGTFLAVGITFLVYTAITVVFSWLDPALLFVPDPNNANAALPFLGDLFRGSFVYILLVAGILFATGSSALSYFITAPRTAQALAQDNLLPRFLSFLGRDFTRNGKEPRFALVLTLVITLVVIWSGDVNVSSRIVGIAFLVVYGWINLAAFFERISGNPSFRPTTKGHWGISLFGFVLSITIIALDSWLLGAIVFGTQLFIFQLLLRYKSENRLEGVWWGLLFGWVSWAVGKMKFIIQGSKNWRPMVGIFAFGDQLDQSQPALEMTRRISQLKGMAVLNVFLGKGINLPKEFVPPPEANLINIPRDDYSLAISSVVQAGSPGGFNLNTILLPLDSRINIGRLVENLVSLDKHVLLYKHSQVQFLGPNRIDIWWKGEENGNLMALLSYIIRESDRERKVNIPHVRLLRNIPPEADIQQATAELILLVENSRLEAQVEIVQNLASFHENLKEYSSDASLVFLGMPGKKTGPLAKVFSMDKIFFENDLKSYQGLPPILFVKAANIVPLFEE